MPNNYLSVLYKHIIQVENKNVGLKVGGGGGGGHKHTIGDNVVHIEMIYYLILFACLYQHRQEPA